MDNKAVPVEDTDIKVEIHSLPAVFMLETRMPDKMVNDLNEYLDELLEDEERRSLAHTLVGQIHRGEQLNMEPDDERLQEYSKFVTHLGAEYINHFIWHSCFQHKNCWKRVYLNLNICIFYRYCFVIHVN